MISNKYKVESYISSKKRKTNNLIESGQVFKTNTYFSLQMHIQVDECFCVGFSYFSYVFFLLLWAVIIACNDKKKENNKFIKKVQTFSFSCAELKIQITKSHCLS